MRTFGLTGGIGMGKTTAGDILNRLGCRVVDTDSIARELTEPGQPALDDIRQVFGADYFEPEGGLRRGALARLVFDREPARRQLEAILHPRIRELWRNQISQWRDEGHRRAVVIIPLLFETNAAGELDRTICVACSEPLQHQRLIGRGWTTEQVHRRIQAQMDVRRKMELADYVAWNDASVDLLEAQLVRIIRDN